uniref:Carboxypeptidase Q n=1 Tax=Plectus sambesii TaxID=2011161 RepID=A0A914WA00_9BILA
AQGFNNVHTEEAQIENWIRGEEVATLKAPREYPMAILGLGASVPTPPGGITAPAFVVDTFDDLDQAGKAGKINGTIVVYNEPWLGSYGQTVAYRSGADHASYYGAVAVLIRSVTTFSIYTPHTGVANYAPTFNNVNVSRIPQASITVEDSMMLRRMQDRGQSLQIYLKMTSYENGTTPGSNIIFEWTGSVFPNEYVVLTGHFDSWDVGQGAMDDGGGCAIAWNTLTALKKLGFQPKRTIRAIFWVGEEMGDYGADSYWSNHKNSTENWIFAFESDQGAFMPSGPANNTYFAVKGNATAMQRLEDIAASVLAANGILFSIQPADNAGGEVNNWADLGTVTANYVNDEKFHGYYFFFHHTNADTMTVLKEEDLDYVTAVLATYTHIIANMDKRLSVA